MLETSQIIKLTLILYKATDSFPKEEPLKCQTREKANRILEHLIMILSQNPFEVDILQKNILIEKALLDITTIRAFLEIAKNQAWENIEHLNIVSNEYVKLTGLIQNLPQKEQYQRQETVKHKSPKTRLPQKESNQIILEGKDRCKKIVEILKQGKAIQVRDAQGFFPKITKRTLRRDFEFLVDGGLIKRQGDKNSTEYILR